MRFLVFALLAVLVTASRRYASRYRAGRRRAPRFYRGQHTVAGAILRDARWAAVLRSMGAWRVEATV